MDAGRFKSQDRARARRTIPVETASVTLWSRTGLPHQELFMKLHRLEPAAADLIDAPVNPEALLSGAPAPQARVTYDAPDERLCAGEWSAGVGTWRVSYDEWEYCLLISGRCVVTGDDGSRIEAGPGDAFVLEPGFTGTWEVLEPMRKHFVVRTP